MNKPYDTKLKQALAELQLTWMRDNHEHELAEAARKNLDQRWVRGKCQKGYF